MKYIAFLLMSVILIACVSCGSSDHLQVEPVDDPGTGDTHGTETHDLFGSGPGETVLLSSLGGALDPVGTSIVNDFDGDGIPNDEETTGNAWTADYPFIESSIAPPVTMRIEVLYWGGTKTKGISSDISSSDTVNSMEFSSEAVHRNEVNLKTVQFADEIINSNSETKNKKHSAGANFSIGGFGFNTSGSSSITQAWNKTHKQTRIGWVNVPFKNNLNRQGWSIKRDEAFKKARLMRSEIREEKDSGFEIKQNAGYVRAALYITNETVNMPVKLSNILCSLLLETPEGQIVPVQSFRLRNDDFSMFEIDLYGGETFGPYVIELKNLNTLEVMEALSKGYNPKIYLVSYDMTHVEDSPYRKILSPGFTGDNLKIVEENAKGRTAAVKIVGPGIRDFYRVAAFDTDGEESRTGSSSVHFVSPGVSLEKALERISYSGTKFEFANYVLDFTGLEPAFDIPGYQSAGPRFHVRGIKSVNGVETKVPIIGEVEGPDGAQTYIMKPVRDWTDEDYRNFSIWLVFDKGKYYQHAGDMSVEGGRMDYSYQDPGAGGMTRVVPMAQGVRSIVWPGDHFDIVYLNLTEHLGLLREFGNNPLDTGETLSFNTRWNRSLLGDDFFDPDVNSQYLGMAGLGDTIEFDIRLDGTWYLYPSFGEPERAHGGRIYRDFNYGRRKSERRFNIQDAFDLEISFGLGGS